MTTSTAITFQRSGAILLDTRHDPDGEIEDTLRGFAELVSAAGTLHTYRISDLTMWSAASTGMQAKELVDTLARHASMRLPKDLVSRVTDYFGRYGRAWIEGWPGDLVLKSDDRVLLREIARTLDESVSDIGIRIKDEHRGQVKAALAEAGYPISDLARTREGLSGGYSLDETVQLRNYQREAVSRFVELGKGGGVILLPCGGGKTVVGVAAAAMLDASALVVTPNRTIGEQWADHFQWMTTLGADDISLFPETIEQRPVSIVTYQSLTSSPNGLSARLHEAIDIPWGLVIYDEVHSLPADVFRQSAALQSRRKLGLTATLVREDGREREVYALVGPPVWQSRWRELERLGWLSPVECFEVRIRTSHDRVNSDHGLAAKIRTAQRIVSRHRDDRVLVAAHRLKEVHALASRLEAPAITGETPQAERKRLYEAFRAGTERCLVVSRVANVGVDLPDANVFVQVSGAFGSRLEEAQRLGRLLRPSNEAKPARFYTLVLPETREREFAQRRQRFLVDQGYQYRVVNARG